MQKHEELRQVIKADNSESDKRYKFEEVINQILLEFVNNKLDLYTTLTRPEVNADLKHQLYRAYLEQSASAVQGSG